MQQKTHKQFINFKKLFKNKKFQCYSIDQTNVNFLRKISFQKFFLLCKTSSWTKKFSTLQTFLRILYQNLLLINVTLNYFINFCFFFKTFIKSFTRSKCSFWKPYLVTDSCVDVVAFEWCSVFFISGLILFAISLEERLLFHVRATHWWWERKSFIAVF